MLIVNISENNTTQTVDNIHNCKVAKIGVSFLVIYMFSWYIVYNHVLGYNTITNFIQYVAAYLNTG